MAIEFLVIGLAGILVGGMFLGMFLTYRETEARRSQARPAAAEGRVSDFYGRHSRDAVLAEELMLRQIEHHLRREVLIAEQFINDPSPKTLRAGENRHLGAC